MRCRKAVLLIHGFAGGTYDLEDLANYLELNRSLDVYSYTLPGHDTRRKDATKENWIKSAEEHIEILINHGYRKIYVVGHSMGGVIASYLATKYNEVKRIVLLAPAFKYFTQEKGIVNKIKESGEAFSAYDNSSRFTFITKLPVRSLIEFRKLVDEYQNTLETLEIPILIIQGNIDKIVPFKNGEYVYKKVKSEKKILVTVDNVGHELIRCERKEEIEKIVRHFLIRWKCRIKNEKIKI